MQWNIHILYIYMYCIMHELFSLWLPSRLSKLEPFLRANQCWHFVDKEDSSSIPLFPGQLTEECINWPGIGIHALKVAAVLIIMRGLCWIVLFPQPIVALWYPRSHSWVVFTYSQNLISKFLIAYLLPEVCGLQYKSKETPQLIGLFSPNLVITNFMQCFLYGPIG